MNHKLQNGQPPKPQNQAKASRSGRFALPKQPHKAGLWIALALLGFTAAWVVTPAKELLSPQALERAIHAVGNFGGLLFVLVFTIVTSLGFPGNVMTVIGGAIFGLWWGSVWSALGATGGAIGAFWLGRYLLRDWVELWFGHNPLLQKIQRSIQHNPFNFVITIRFTPISPFSLVNFLFGLTPLDLKTYAIGTLLGIIPSTIAYAWIGVSGKTALSGGDRLSLFLALGFLTLLSLVPMLLKKRTAG